MEFMCRNLYNRPELIVWLVAESESARINRVKLPPVSGEGGAVREQKSNVAINCGMSAIVNGRESFA